MSRRRPQQRGSDPPGGQGTQMEDLTQIFSGPGKDFKAKMVGSAEIGDYRGNTVISDTLGLLRKSTTRKTKVAINIKFKGLVVIDEKSKIKVLEAPIERVKFVCHDKQDVKVFAAVIQVPVSEGAFLPYKLYCFQAEKATSVLFVHSANEMFQLLFRIMQSRREAARAREGQATQGNTSSRRASQGATGQKNSNSGQTTEVEDDTPVTLGFGIPAPPPSYKAAVSKKTAATYPVPSGMKAQATALALPPSKKTVSSSIAKPRPRRQVDLPEYSTIAETSTQDQQAPAQVTTTQPEPQQISTELPDYSTIEEMGQQSQSQVQSQQAVAAAQSPRQEQTLVELPEYSTIEEMGQQSQPQAVSSQQTMATQQQSPQRREIREETPEYCTIDEMNQMSSPTPQEPQQQQMQSQQNAAAASQKQQQQVLIRQKQQQMQQELQSQQAQQVSQKQQQQMLMQQKQQQMLTRKLSEQGLGPPPPLPSKELKRPQKPSHNLQGPQIQPPPPLPSKRPQKPSQNLQGPQIQPPPPLPSKELKLQAKSQLTPATSQGPPARLPPPPKQKGPPPQLPPKDQKMTRRLRPPLPSKDSPTRTAQPDGPPPPLSKTEQEVLTQQSAQLKAPPPLPPKQSTSRKFQDLPPVPIESFLGHSIDEHSPPDSPVNDQSQVIYDVPPSGEPVPKEGVLSEKAKKEAVWEEWSALQNDLEDLAKDLGMDGVSSDGTHKAEVNRQRNVQEAASTIAGGGEASATPFDASFSESFSEDPFADNLFKQSFRSPLNSFAGGPQAQAPAVVGTDQTADSGAFFTSFDSSNGWPSFENATGGAVKGSGDGGGGGVAPQSPWGDDAFSLPTLDFASGALGSSGQPSQPSTASAFEFDANFDFSPTSQSQVASSTAAANITSEAFNAFNTDTTNADWGSESMQATSPSASATVSPPNASSDEGQAVYSIITHVPPETPNSGETSDQGAGIYSIITDANLNEDVEEEQQAVYSVVNKVRSPSRDDLSSQDAQVQDLPTAGIEFEANWNSVTSSAAVLNPFGQAPAPGPSLKTSETDFTSAWSELEQVAVPEREPAKNLPSSPPGNAFETNWDSLTNQAPSTLSVSLVAPADDMGWGVVPAPVALTTVVQSKPGPVCSTSVDPSKAAELRNPFEEIGVAASGQDQSGSSSAWGTDLSSPTAVPDFKLTTDWAAATAGSPQSSTNKFDDNWGSGFGQDVLSDSTFSPSTQNPSQMPTFSPPAVENIWPGPKEQSTPVSGTGEASFHVDAWATTPPSKVESSSQILKPNGEAGGFEADWNALSNLDSQLKSIVKESPVEVSSPPASASTVTGQSSFTADFSSLSFGDNTTAQVSNPLYKSDNTQAGFAPMDQFPSPFGQPQASQRPVAAISPPAATTMAASLVGITPPPKSSRSSKQHSSTEGKPSVKSQSQGSFATDFSSLSLGNNVAAVQGNNPLNMSNTMEPGNFQVGFGSMAPTQAQGQTQQQPQAWLPPPQPAVASVGHAPQPPPPSPSTEPVASLGGITPPPKSSRRSSRRQRHSSIDGKPNKAAVTGQGQDSFSADFNSLSLGGNTTAQMSNPLYKSGINATGNAFNLQGQTGSFGTPENWPRQSPTPPRNQNFSPSPFPNQTQLPSGPQQQQYFGAPHAQQQQYPPQGSAPQQQQFGAPGPYPQQFSPQGQPFGARGPSPPLQYPGPPQGPSGQQYGPPQQQQFGNRTGSPDQGFNVQPGYNVPQGVMPQQGANMMPQQGANMMPQQGANMMPQQGANMMPQQGANMMPQQGVQGGGNFGAPPYPGGLQPPQPNVNVSPAPRQAPTISLDPSAFADLLPLALSPQKSKFKVKDEDKAVKSLMESREEAKKFEKETVPTLNDLKSKNEPKLKPPSGDNFISFD